MLASDLKELCDRLIKSSGKNARVSVLETINLHDKKVRPIKAAIITKSRDNETIIEIRI